MEVTSEVHRRGWEIKVGRAREVVEVPEPKHSNEIKQRFNGRIIPQKKGCNGGINGHTLS